MKNADENFGDMLSSCPFDDSIREEHRREVRERAMRAFDESAATPMLTVADREQSPQRRTRRRTVRAALAMAVAASLGWAIFAWQEPAGPGETPAVATHQPAEARLKSRELADERLVAALDLLSTFDDEQAALTFAQGIEVCVRERDWQLAVFEDGGVGDGS